MTQPFCQVMTLYLDFLFEYLFPLTLSDAIFHESILLVGVVVTFSMIICLCLWGSSVTPSAAKPLQAVVEIALTIVFQGLEPWVNPRLMGSFMFILLLHVPEEAGGAFTPMSLSMALCASRRPALLRLYLCTISYMFLFLFCFLYLGIFDFKAFCLVSWFFFSLFNYCFLFFRSSLSLVLSSGHLCLSCVRLVSSHGFIYLCLIYALSFRSIQSFGSFVSKVIVLVYLYTCEMSHKAPLTFSST